MSEEGNVQFYKQKITGMDRKTLQNVFKTIERDWGLQIHEFPKFEQLIKTGEWREGSNGEVENMERSSNGTQFLFYNVQQSGYNTGKYNLVICHLNASTEISQDVLIGGMINEGLLARDTERDELYLC